MQSFDIHLDQWKAKGRFRALALPNGIDFSSNDYLGLSTHPVLRETAIQALQSGIEIGASGSRLLRGHRDAHAELEAFAALYFNVPKALFFPNGFQANYALITTLVNRRDTVIFDALCHASMRDGLFATRCDTLKVAHNNLDAIETALKKPRRADARVWIMVESVYSMEGDIAPVAEMLALAEAYDAILVVDEAHGTGVFGATGRGVTEGLPHDRLISIHTCGKALGVAGALICADTPIIDYMINAARPFIYSTAPMPLQAILVKRALELVREEPQRRAHLFSLMGQMADAFPELPVHSPIIPVIIGPDTATMDVASALQEQGYDVRGIRPPTVPEGTARLRLSLNANLSSAEVAAFALCLQETLRLKGITLR